MSFVKNYLTNVCEIEKFYDEDDAEKILENLKKVKIGTTLYKRNLNIILMFLKMTLYICQMKMSNIYHPFGEMTICLMISLLKKKHL